MLCYKSKNPTELHMVVKHQVLTLTTREDFGIRKKTSKRVVKGILVIPERPNFFPIKCEMACFFLVSRDFIRSREP